MSYFSQTTAKTSTTSNVEWPDTADQHPASTPTPDEVCPFLVLLPLCVATWGISVESRSIILWSWCKNLMAWDFILCLNQIKSLCSHVDGPNPTGPNLLPLFLFHFFCKHDPRTPTHTLANDSGILGNQLVRQRSPTPQTGLVWLVCLTSLRCAFLRVGRHLVTTRGQTWVSLLRVQNETRVTLDECDSKRPQAQGFYLIVEPAEFQTQPRVHR